MIKRISSFVSKLWERATISGNKFLLEGLIEALSSLLFPSNNPKRSCILMSTIIEITPTSPAIRSFNFLSCLFSLIFLFSISNIKNIDSVRKRILGGDRTQAFAAGNTNAPAITIGRGSWTIANLWMHDSSGEDGIGIRVFWSTLTFATGDSVAWTGALSSTNLLETSMREFILVQILFRGV